MQYLLTEQEYKRLTEKPGIVQENMSEKIQRLCTQVAENMPVKVEWLEGGPKPWGCILSKTNNPRYCDHCPVEDVCPNEDKEFSK